MYFGCKAAVKRGQSNRFELPNESRLASFHGAKIKIKIVNTKIKTKNIAK